jgi:hypothetical protein
MHSPTLAIAWEFWSANRRGWLLVLSALAICGLVIRAFATAIHDSESLQFLTYLPLVGALILAVSFCNFTDRSRRDGIAGFPRHLFTLPVNTARSVTCAMCCSLLSVVGIYVAWVTLVLKPLDVALLIRWPATLLAAFVVFYQAIIWCLCGFRLTRVVSLSLAATLLVAIGFFPTLRPKADFWASEFNLSASLFVLMAVAYVATLVTVGMQRRGGARGWAVLQETVERIASAIPHPQVTPKTPDAALFWFEWRRSGFVLPIAVLLITALILGPVLSITGRSDSKTLWAEMWLFMMPVLMAFPIGLGLGKPDFWSLDLALAPFAATRPVTSAQLLAAKLKTAAWSALLAWMLLLLVAPTIIYATCKTDHWEHMWRSSAMLYSPLSQWLLPILAIVAAVFITWSLLVAGIWLGYSGRPGFYYSMTSVGLAAFLIAFFRFIWWLDHPRSHGDTFVGVLPWLPWALAIVVTFKAFATVLCVRELRRRHLVSDREVIVYSCAWLGATICLVVFASLLSPRIGWFRDTAIIAAFVAIPTFTIALAPLTISWNRHR